MDNAQLKAFVAEHGDAVLKPLDGSAGGSKARPNSRASLHSKAVIIDQRWSIIGSMNLDLRSQKQNSESALVIRSAALCAEAARQIDATLRSAAWRLVMRPVEVDRIAVPSPPRTRGRRSLRA